MRKILFFVILLILFYGYNSQCEDIEYGELYSLKIEIPDYTSCIWATDRETLIESIKNYEFPLIFSLTISKNEVYEMKIKTIEDIPRSPIYVKDNYWMIYYKNNHGYMPITLSKN